MQKKAFMKELVSASLVLIVLLLGFTIISSNRDSSNQIFDIFSEQSKLENNDLLIDDSVRTYDLKEKIDSEEDFKSVKTTLVPSSYVENLLVNMEDISSNNFTIMNSFFNYYNYAGSYRSELHNIILKTNYFGVNFDDRLFLCNMMSNRKDIQIDKVDLFYSSLESDKVGYNYLKLIYSLASDFETEALMDLYRGEGSLEKISERISGFDHFYFKKGQEINSSLSMKTMYLKRFDSLYSRKSLSDLRDLILSKLNLDYMTLEKTYAMASVFYNFPCIIFDSELRYSGNFFYMTSSGVVLFDQKLMGSEVSLSEIRKTYPKLFMGKSYSRFLDYDEIFVVEREEEFFNEDFN